MSLESIRLSASTYTLSTVRFCNRAPSILFHALHYVQQNAPPRDDDSSVVDGKAMEVEVDSGDQSLLRAFCIGRPLPSGFSLESSSRPAHPLDAVVCH